MRCRPFSIGYDGEMRAQRSKFRNNSTRKMEDRREVIGPNFVRDNRDLQHDITRQ